MRILTVLMIILAVTLPIPWIEALPTVIGQSTTNPPNIPSWRETLAHPSQQGCFTITYPSVIWQSVHCVTPPSYPLTSSTPSTVGGGHDETAYSGSTLIGSSTGSFPNVVGITSETDSDGSIYCDSSAGTNCYSLQDNSNTFTTSTTYTGGESADGWEQFVLSNSPSGAYIFIQYWLIGHGSSCEAYPSPPAGTSWMYYPGTSNTAAGCYANSYSATVPYEAASNLGNLVLEGYANSNSNDGISYCISGTCYSVSLTDQVLNLYEYWQYSEFNLFGYCCGSQANFNSGTSLTVVNALADHNENPITPTCELTGYTAETNNLNLGSCSPSSGEIVFTENNGNFATLTTSVASGQGSVSPNCSSPTSCQEPVGSSVSLTATPSTEWQFSSWTITEASCSGGSSANPCQFTMPSNTVTLAATFTQLAFTLLTGVDSGSGSVSPSCPSPSGCSENAGTQLTVTATASPGWVFGSWSTQVGISCSVNPCSFTMPNNPVTMGTTFLQSTTISLSVAPSSTTVGSSVTLSGSISPNPGTVTVTISVSENSGATYTTLISFMTNNSGSYSTTWSPPAPNNYQLMATWSGNNQFAGSSSSSESLSVTGTSPPTPTILFPAPASVQHGQTVTLTVTVFNPSSSVLNANITIQIDGPNNYVLFDVIKIPVNANSQSSGYYDWAVPTQTGTYTATVSLLPRSLSGVDTETIQVT